MAKKIAASGEDDGKEKTNEEYASELEKTIAKKYGNVSFSGNDIRERKRILIPTTPTLDLSLCGGIREGSWTILTGKPKCGKTTMALQIAANAQKLGKFVYYFNVEHRFEFKNLSTVHHLKTTPDCFKLFESTKEKYLSAEDHLNLAKDVICGHPGCLVIFDSISCLCPENEMAKDIGDMGRPEGPKMYGQFCRQMASRVPLNNIAFIGILHVIANTSGYGESWVEDGGVKIQFQCDTKLKHKTSWNWEEGSGENKKKIGKLVDWDIVFSANGRPGDIVQTAMRYGYGFDDTYEIVTLGIELGQISQSGTWFSTLSSTGEEIRGQGKPKLCEYFTNNPLELEFLHNKIKEIA